MSKNHSSKSHPDVPNKPGKTNWVEEEGGLPPFLRRVIKHIKADSKGMTWSHAVAAGVNALRRMKTPEAKKALAQWEAMKARARAKRAAKKGLSTGAPAGWTPEKQAREIHAEKKRKWDEAAHPRAAAGSPEGGQFVAAGEARDERGKKAQENKGAESNYKKALEADDPRKMIGELGDADLEALTEYLYSFKSADKSVVSRRLMVAAELRKRGKDVNDFGGRGKGRPAGKSAETNTQLARASKRDTVPLELAYDKFQPRWPKGHPKAGQWMDVTPGDGKGFQANELMNAGTTSEQIMKLVYGPAPATSKVSFNSPGAYKPSGDASFVSINPTTGPTEAQKAMAASLMGKSAPSPKTKTKAPIKKNSVEYWERARDLTLEAQAKHKPGSKIWMKMEERRKEQQAIIDSMKESGKTTLSQDEWKAQKAAPASPAPSASPSTDTPYKMSAEEIKNLPTTSALTQSAAFADVMLYTQTSPDKITYAVEGASGQVKTTTQTPWSDQSFVAYVPELNAWKVNTPSPKKAKPAPSNAADDALEVELDGGPDKKVPVTTGSTPKFDEDYVDALPSIDGDDMSSSQWMIAQSAKMIASAYGDPIFIYRDPQTAQWQTGNTMPDKSQYFVVAKPDGSFAVNHTGSSAPSSNAVTEGMFNAGLEPVSMLALPDKQFSAAVNIKNQSKDPDASGAYKYAVKNLDNGSYKYTDQWPGVGAEYFAAKDGKVFYNPGSAASASAAAAPAPNAPNSSKLAPPAPTNTPAGLDTPMIFSNEDTRSFGLDAMSGSSASTRAFEGTPEGAALAGTLIPMVDEIAGHYRASNVKIPSGSKGPARQYTGSSYHSYNDPLRGKSPMTADRRQKIEKMDGAVAAYALPVPTVLTRATNKYSLPSENLVGKPLRDNAYMSTSVGFASSFGGDAVLHIYAPAGTRGISVDGAFEDGGLNPGEREFILPRGTTLMVSRDEIGPDGARHITGTVIPVPTTAPTPQGVSGVPSQATGIDPAGYSAAGLEYLRRQGRVKWEARFAKNTTLSLAHGTWYNRLVKERHRRVTGSMT